MKKCIALVVVAMAACNGPQVDLGGREGEGVSSADAGPSKDAGTTPVTPPAGRYPIESPACTYEGPYSDGSGFLADIPAACSDPAGSPSTPISVAQVEAALVGTWSECAIGSDASSGFARTIDENAGAIEFASDGHFTLLTYGEGTQDISLVPATGASDSGTFDVVDASSSLGPGTFQVRLSASDGGVHSAQVVVFDSTSRLRFFSPGASDYTHATTRRYQANVCGLPVGPIDTPSNGDEALARMLGRWARCATPGVTSSESAFEGEGVELPGDGTWYALVESAAGDLVRATAPLDHGTVEVVGSSPPSLKFLQGTYQTETLQPVLGVCGTLTFAGDLPSFEYVHLQ